MQRKPTLKNSIVVAFVQKLDDPRAPNVSHPLETVIFSLLVGVVCGANDLVNAAHIARKKQKFIERFVPCRHGTPTHDTMGRVLAMLDPVAFAEAFAFFMSRVTNRRFDDVINIDGKTLRGVMSKLGRGKKGANVDDQVHIVSAFEGVRGYVLGQLRSRQVISEHAAAQELIRLLAINGCTVTLDAGHNSVTTLAMIVERGANVVVTVKNNNLPLLKVIKAAFKTKNPTLVEETVHAHGRIEHRRYAIVVADADSGRERFSMLKAYVRTERQLISQTGAVRKPAVTYYATSWAAANADRIADCVRRRWGIETKLHYVLDVIFEEDASRVRVGHAAENFSRTRHLALNLLRLDTVEQGSVETKRHSAAIDDAYLEQLVVAPVAA